MAALGVRARVAEIDVAGVEIAQDDGVGELGRKMKERFRERGIRNVGAEDVIRVNGRLNGDSDNV